MASKAKSAAATTAKLPPVKLLPSEHVLEYAINEAESTAAAFNIIELLIDRGVRQIIEQDYERRAIQSTALQAVQAVVKAVDQRTLHLKRDRGETINSYSSQWFASSGHCWDCEPEPLRCPIDRLARQAIEKIDVPYKPLTESCVTSPNQHLRHRSVISMKSRASHSSPQSKKRGNTAQSTQPAPPAPYPLPVNQPSPRDEAARVALLNILRQHQAERMRLAAEAAEAVAAAAQAKQAEERAQMQLASQRRQAARSKAKKATSPHSPQETSHQSLSQTIALSNNKPVPEPIITQVPPSKPVETAVPIKRITHINKPVKHQSSINEESKQQIVTRHSDAVQPVQEETVVKPTVSQAPIASFKSQLTPTQSLPLPVRSPNHKQESISTHKQQTEVLEPSSVPVRNAEVKQSIISQPTLKQATLSTAFAAQHQSPLESTQVKQAMSNTSPSCSIPADVPTASPPANPSKLTVKSSNGKKSNKKASSEPRDTYTGAVGLLSAIMSSVVPATGVTLTYESDTRAGPEISSTSPTTHFSLPLEHGDWNRSVASLSLAQYRNWQEQRYPPSASLSHSRSRTQTLTHKPPTPVSQSDLDTSPNVRPPTALFIPDHESHEEETKEQINFSHTRESVVITSHPPPVNGNRKLSFDTMVLQSSSWGHRQSVPTSNKPAGGVILPLIHARMTQGEYQPVKKDRINVVPSRKSQRLTSHSSAPVKPMSAGEVLSTGISDWLDDIE